jgi:aspartyl-tRNA(Asn)/glutamyl-tRNA(Gln) amidotransferase subunit A
MPEGEIMDLTQLTISECSDLLARGEISPVELTTAHLERIHKVDPQLNCFITLTAEIALAQAHQAEVEFQTDKRRGDLHGIPLALKDLYETRNIRTTAGSQLFRDYLPSQDATTVQKLYQAGAILLGKLNMHEIALGVTNVNPHYGASHNPWGRTRSTGGSSGGSAAALISGMCMGSLGTDTGGSIRIPASLCGVVGLKPTTGRVSLRGVIPLSWNLDHAGPLARSVRDAALLLQAIAGYDAQDPYSADTPVPDYLAGLGDGVRGLRVALATDEFFTCKTDPHIWRGLEDAAQVFSRLGAKVERVAAPQAHEAALANGLMVTSDAAAFHHERMARHMQDFGEDIRLRLESGAAVTSTEYSQARHLQTTLRRRYAKFFETYDILLTPTTPVAAPIIMPGPDAIEQARRLTRFVSPFNLIGLPALSLPCGFNPDGLPFGLQIVSRSWGEATVLQAAYAYEQETSWHLQWPVLD